MTSPDDKGSASSSDALGAIRTLRWVAAAEGVSFLLLLFVAMPLKYGAGWPLGVRVGGMLHGVLFIAFVLTLGRAALEARWGIARVLGAFVSSLVPFGWLWLDRVLRRDAQSEKPLY